MLNLFLFPWKTAHHYRLTSGTIPPVGVTLERLGRAIQGKKVRKGELREEGDY